MPIGHRIPGHYTMSWTKRCQSLVEKSITIEKSLSSHFFSGRKTRLFHVRSISVSATSGLVQDIEHQVLPAITPSMTFLLTVIFMIVMSSSSGLIFAIFGLFSQV